MEKIYKVMVDYSKSLAEMIEEGKYYRYNAYFDDVNDKRFPVRGIGQQVMELFLVRVKINWNPSTDQVLTYLDSVGLAPAKIEHLLAFGAAYPQIVDNLSWIVALGSRQGFFPSLSRNSRGMLVIDLLCDYDRNNWGRDYHLFLSIRKTE